VTVSIHHASCLDWLAEYDGPLFDSCVTDPPYEIGFMGKKWDNTGVAFQPETWRAIYDVLKPGAHLVAFSGTRTYHRMACAIEDAGFEIRDQLGWAYGSGFPKSHDVSKGIDKAAGVERETIKHKARPVTSGTMSGASDTRPWIEKSRETGFHEVAGNKPATPQAEQWQGWGTALKPSWEPICLARKPLSEKSIAANVLKHGTGAINIDGCRVGTEGGTAKGSKPNGEGNGIYGNGLHGNCDITKLDAGRWPANLIHDGSDEVLAGFPETTTNPGTLRSNVAKGTIGLCVEGREGTVLSGGDSGSAARFFYSAKAGPLDRIGTAHATVKPVDLMRWLVRMVTPPGGHILEPFAGSGTTGIAAMAEGFDCTMIELEAEHVADIERKLAFLRGEGALTFQEHNHAKLQRAKETPLGGLFGGAA
jgi:site-specific DNA-methyltransferase (adenine-specific)